MESCKYIHKTKRNEHLNNTEHLCKDSVLIETCTAIFSVCDPFFLPCRLVDIIAVIVIVVIIVLIVVVLIVVLYYRLLMVNDVVFCNDVGYCNVA